MRLNDTFQLKTLNDEGFSRRDINQVISNLKKDDIVIVDGSYLEKGDKFPSLQNVQKRITPKFHNLEKIVSLDRNNDNTITDTDIWDTVKNRLISQLRPIFQDKNEDSIKKEDQSIRNKIQKETLKILNNQLAENGLTCRHVSVIDMSTEKNDLKDEVIENLPTFTSLSKRSIDTFIKGNNKAEPSKNSTKKGKKKFF
jgi:hypothetical protein